MAKVKTKKVTLVLTVNAPETFSNTKLVQGLNKVLAGDTSAGNALSDLAAAGCKVGKLKVDAPAPAPATA